MAEDERISPTASSPFRLSFQRASRKRRNSRFHPTAIHGRLRTVVKLGFGLLLAILGLALAPLHAAEYYRWVDDNGVLHITDSLHNVPPAKRGNANRIQTTESPRVAEPEVKPPPPRKVSVPFERNGNIVVVPVTLNNRQTTKLVVDTGASYTFISHALA